MALDSPDPWDTNVLFTKVSKMSTIRMILLASRLNYINLGMGAGVGGDTTYKRKLKPHVAFRKTSLQLFEKNKHCYKKM